MTRFVLLLFLVSPYLYGQESRNSYYVTNQPPLIAQPYTALPLGSIKPKGMLLEMVKRQRSGLTGRLDSIYSLVCGPSNGWLGGEGDGWERGPYWIDGLVPLAYLLDDAKLKAKAQQWIEWSISHQRADGYFGPVPLEKDHQVIRGTQQDDREDWWPKMVMLKALQQYYSATEDKRVLTLMTGYFHYMLTHLPEQPLGHWTYWGEQRGGDNLAIVYWLYNITHDAKLLALGQLIHKQTFPWTRIFTDNTLRRLNPPADIHCVNFAQGLKEPVVFFQQSKNPADRDASREGLKAIIDGHGFVNGMYGADEHLHGNNPTQGSELCSAVEMMYSFESMLPVTGDMYYGDYLEKLAYNVLPTQSTDDYMRKQYFQQPNQVMITNESRNFLDDNNGHLVYGTTNGYPCCVTNMHQGWPKFIQNLWYATATNGVAALVYGESEVKIRIAGGKTVRIEETTNYPFSDEIRFKISTDQPVKFPFHLRVPQWCRKPLLKVNGKEVSVTAANDVMIISRNWSNGDEVVLTLPMEFRTSGWYNQSAGIERGPLIFALKIREDWSEVTKTGFDDTYWEVKPKSPWNYSFTNDEIRKKNFLVEFTGKGNVYPWNLESAPIVVKAKAFRVADWTLVNGQTGMLPSPSSTLSLQNKTAPLEDIELIPYGCTTLRIAEFPVLR